MKKLQTIAIHGHGHIEEKVGPLVPPVYLTSVFEQPGGPRVSDRGVDLKYSREENPTVRATERVIAGLERGEDALCFSSGMAAVSTLFISTLKRGSRLVLPAESYWTTVRLALEMKRFGVHVSLVWPETSEIIEAINEETNLVFVETITNPTLRLIDIEEVAKRCRETEALFVVDNTFATPVLYRPLEHGADLVLHSATKYLSGHNDVVAGAIVGERGRIRYLWDWRCRLGNTLAPLEAYLLLRGMKTLELRVRRQSENALSVAEFLSEHPRVKDVMYPGLPDNKYHSLAKKMLNGGYGGVVSFRIKGGRNEVYRFMRKLSIIRPAPSFGGAESTLSYPFTSAMKTIPEDMLRKLGITEDLLRLSVGLEDVNDVIEDLDSALNSV